MKVVNYILTLTLLVTVLYLGQQVQRLSNLEPVQVQYPHDQLEGDVDYLEYGIRHGYEVFDWPEELIPYLMHNPRDTCYLIATKGMGTIDLQFYHLSQYE